MRTTLSVFLMVVLFPATVTAQMFSDRSDLLSDQNRQLHAAWGASIADFDGNGLADIYEPGIMYLQQEDGSFLSSLTDLGIEYRQLPTGGVQWGRGIFGSIMADVDDDGFSELVVMDITPDSSHFYKGHFGMRLEEVGPDVGIVFKGLGQGATFADFNGDGTLDLFFGEERGANQLFLGDGAGSFTEFTSQAGIFTTVQTYGVATADYDNDGDMDVFIGACAADPAKSVNMLFRNNGDGTFDEVGAVAGINDNLAAWGVVWLDYDRDGWMDVYVANMIMAQDNRPGTNILYRNKGDGTFEDVSQTAGVAGVQNAFSFGNAAVDFNNDGWTDLYSANNIAAPNIYLNNGDGTFTDSFATSGMSDIFQNFSVATGDLNDDGWIDVFSGADNTPYSRIFLNNGGTNHWLKVSLVQAGSNRKAIGARLEAWNDGTVQLRDITSGDGFSSQNMAHIAHFGLGTHAAVDSLVIRWPDGSRETRTGLAADQHVWLEKGGDQNAPPAPFRAFTFVVTKGVNQIGATAEWEETTDPDGDAISYQVAVRAPNGQIVHQSAEGVSTPYSFELSEPLQDGAYEYVVAARDGLNTRRSVNIGSVLIEGTNTDVAPHPVTTALTSVWPNPASERVTIRMESARPDVADWVLIDMLGRQVRDGSELLTSGVHDLHVDLQGLAAGLYHFRSRVGDTLLSQSVVVAQ